MPEQTGKIPRTPCPEPCKSWRPSTPPILPIRKIKIPAHRAFRWAGQSVNKAAKRQNTEFDDWRFVFILKIINPQSSQNSSRRRKIATQCVLTYCATCSCCGSRHPRWRKRLPRLPTAATRSGRLIRHRRRFLRSPLEYPHTLRSRVTCLDGFIDL